MRRTPEALIAHLRNRKGRVITCGILAVICLGVLAYEWYTLTEMMAALVPGEGSNPLSHVVMNQVMLVGISFMQTLSLATAAGLGAAFAALISQLVGFTKDDLLVQLWDRVQMLEQSQHATSEDARQVRGA